MKKDYQSKLVEMFSATSGNFMGTGVTLEEFVRVNMAERVQAAWFNQDRKECRRRLNFVIALSIELTKIKEQITFCTGLAEMGIESVIEGDWKMVQEWAEHFTFADEDEQIRANHASVYAHFHELLMQAYDTRPGEMDAKA